MWSTATSTGPYSTDADAEATAEAEATEATEAEATEAEATEAEAEATEAEVRAALPNYYALCWQLESTLRERGRVSDPAAGARLLARSEALVAQYRVPAVQP